MDSFVAPDEINFSIAHFLSRKQSPILISLFFQLYHAVSTLLLHFNPRTNWGPTLQSVFAKLAPLYDVTYGTSSTSSLGLFYGFAVVFQVLMIGLFCMAQFSLKRGQLARKSLYSLRFLQELYSPVLVVQFAAITFNIAACTYLDRDANFMITNAVCWNPTNGPSTIIAMMFVVILLYCATCTSFFVFPFIPSASSIASRMSGVGQVIDTWGLTFILGFRAYEGTLPLQYIAGILYGVSLLYYYNNRFPYYRPFQNAFYAGKGCAVLVICVCGLIARIYDDNTVGATLGVVALVAILPAFLVGGFVNYVLFVNLMHHITASEAEVSHPHEHYIERGEGLPIGDLDSVNSPTNDTPRSGSRDSGNSGLGITYGVQHIEDPWLVSVLVRKFTQSFLKPIHKSHAFSFDSITMIFEDVALQFPNDPNLARVFALHVLAYKDNPLLADALLKKAERNIDTESTLTKYEWYRVAAFQREVSRAIGPGGAFLADAQEVQRAVLVAQKYVASVRLHLRSFWKSMLQEEDPSSILNTVVSLDKAHREAERLFKILLRRYPRSSVVLHAYAEFLRDAENDREASDKYHETATELQEYKVRKSAFSTVDSHDGTSSTLNSSRPGFAPSGSECDLSVGSGSQNARPGILAGKVRKRNAVAPLLPEQNIPEEPAPVVRKKKVNYDDDSSSKVGRDTASAKEHVGHISSAASVASRSDVSTESTNAKMRHYRKSLSKGHSSAIQLVVWCISGMILSMLVYVIFSYAFSTAFMSASTSLGTSSTLAKAMDISAASLGMSAAFRFSFSTMTSAISTFESSMLDLTSSKTVDTSSLALAWFSERYNLMSFTSGSFSSNSSFTNTLQGSSRQVIEAARGAYTAGSGTVGSDAAFLLYNDMIIVSQAFDSSLSKKYASVWSKNVDTYNLNAQIAGIVSSSLIFLFAVFVFAPAYRLMLGERSSVLRLISTVPKGTLSSLYNYYKTAVMHAADFDEKAEASLEISDGNGHSVDSQLLFRMTGVVLLFLLWGNSFFISSTSISTTSQQKYGELRQFGAVMYYSQRIRFWSGELIAASSLWTASDMQAYVIADAAQLVENWQILATGQNSFPVAYPGLQNTDDSSLYAACFTGTDSIDGLVSRLASLANRIGNGEAGLTSSVVQISDTLLPTTMSRARSLWLNKYDTTAEVVRIANLLLFMVFWPIFVLSTLLVVRSALDALYAENERLRRMLLLLPTDVIDSNAGIRDYILSGDRVNAKKISQALKESEERTRSMLEASVDGVVEFDDSGVLSVVNKAAAKMFQYTAEDVLGKDVRMMFEDIDGKKIDDYITEVVKISNTRRDNSAAQGRVFDLTGHRKDSSSFPVRLSVSWGAVGERRMFAGFLRDLSIEKKHEELLIKEKKRSEQLLTNIMPKHVADRLLRGETIADQFEDVSIVFLDICNFTPFSQTKKPIELVSILNKIFTRFDDLCAKHKLQKIKTIGDALFAIAGLTEDHAHPEHACAFALDALACIAAFNRETGTELNIRVGVHTGSVVAGVLGTRTLAYDCWSNNVNIASRMESSSLPGKAQISRQTYERVHDQFVCAERGEIAVKGVGKMVTYFVQDAISAQYAPTGGVSSAVTMDSSSLNLDGQE
eukprot:ANDGO_01376.mRNA.1 Adenylate cyclase